MLRSTPGCEHVLTSDSMFDLEPFPRRLVVVGGGYIACEFASIFHGLGAHVTQLYRGEQVLRGFDDDISAALAGELAKQHVTLKQGAEVTAIANCPASAPSATPMMPMACER